MNFLNWLSNKYGDIFIKITFHFYNTFSKKVSDEYIQRDRDSLDNKRIN